jgi:hypothetical protein
MSTLDPTEPPYAPAWAYERGLGMAVKLSFIGGLTATALREILPITFQTAPLNSFPVSRSYPATKYDTVIGQQYARPGVTQLETYSWQTIFTDAKYHWQLLHGDEYVPEPLVMLEKLDAVGRKKTPILLTARNPLLRSAYDVNTPALLESLNSEMREGEIDAYYVSVEFTEFREPKYATKQKSKAPTKKKTTKSRRGGGPRGSGGWVRVDSKATTTHGRGGTPTHRVVANRLRPGRDTLYSLAAYFYGAPEQWRRIAQANHLTIAPSKSLRTLGAKVLTIPTR